jgi:hypothetical protein
MDCKVPISPVNVKKMTFSETTDTYNHEYLTPIYLGHILSKVARACAKDDYNHEYLTPIYLGHILSKVARACAKDDKRWKHGDQLIMECKQCIRDILQTSTHVALQYYSLSLKLLVSRYRAKGLYL